MHHAHPGRSRWMRWSDLAWETQWKGWPPIGLLLALAYAAVGAAEPPPPSVSEQVFFGRLGVLIDAGQWADAARHLQQAQAVRPSPPWLTTRDGEVRWAQLRIAQAQGERLAMLAAARLFLNGDETRTQQLFAWIQSLRATGDRANALALLKELVYREPMFAEGARLLAEWERASPTEPKRTPAPSESRAPAPSRSASADPDDPEALLAQIHSSREQDNLPGMLAAARLFLNGDVSRSQRLVERAREYFARGDRRVAALLVREVLRRTSDLESAQQLQREIEAADQKR